IPLPQTGLLPDGRPLPAWWFHTVISVRFPGFSPPQCALYRNPVLPEDGPVSYPDGMVFLFRLHTALTVSFLSLLPKKRRTKNYTRGGVPLRAPFLTLCIKVYFSLDFLSTLL